MHDIKAIRENPEAYDRHWSAKGRSTAWVGSSAGGGGVLDKTGVRKAENTLPEV